MMPAQLPPLALGQVEAFRHLIAERLGLDFDDHKRAFLGELLQRRAGDDVNAYLQALAVNGDGELRRLVPELTVAETYFFRNAHQFSSLVETVLPERIRTRAGERVLRILSAGCASGEEPYSIAMLLRDRFPELAGWKVELLAVDLNPAVLDLAHRGRYSEWSLRETPAAVRAGYFRRDGREYVLDAGIRDAVRFEEGDLGRPDAGFWQPGCFDVILCRNVMMYFLPERMRQVVERLAGALAPGGYLFLGHAETLRGLTHQCQLRHTHDTFYYQRQPADTAQPVAASPVAAVPWDADSWVEAVGAASRRIQKLAVGRPQVPSAAVAPQAAPAHRALDLVRREKYREALAVLGDGADPESELMRAALLANAGEIAAAESACRRLLAVNNLNAEAHYVLALCREHAGDGAGAMEHDRMAAHLDPEFALPHLHLGLQARRGGETDAARRALQTAVRILLRQDDALRLLLFGGGFSRAALLEFAQNQLKLCGGAA